MSNDRSGGPARAAARDRLREHFPEASTMQLEWAATDVLAAVAHHIGEHARAETARVHRMLDLERDDALRSARLVTTYLATIRWYADAGNYLDGVPGEAYRWDWQPDGGSRARRALAEPGTAPVEHRAVASEWPAAAAEAPVGPPVAASAGRPAAASVGSPAAGSVRRPAAASRPAEPPAPPVARIPRPRAP